MHAIRQSCSDLSGEETEHSFERAEAAIEVEQIRGRAGETSRALTQARTSRINQAESGKVEGVREIPEAPLEREHSLACLARIANTRAKSAEETRSTGCCVNLHAERANPERSYVTDPSYVPRALKSLTGASAGASLRPERHFRAALFSGIAARSMPRMAVKLPTPGLRKPHSVKIHRERCDT